MNSRLAAAIVRAACVSR